MFPPVTAYVRSFTSVVYGVCLPRATCLPRLQACSGVILTAIQSHSDLLLLLAFLCLNAEESWVRWTRRRIRVVLGPSSALGCSLSFMYFRYMEGEERGDDRKLWPASRSHRCSYADVEASQASPESAHRRVLVSVHTYSPFQY